MASKTKHLGLELTGNSRLDRNTLFSMWRSIINGEGVGSNMELIDEAFGRTVTDESNVIIFCGNATEFIDNTVDYSEMNTESPSQDA